MKLKTTRPVDGLRWMRDGVKTFSRYPLGFASMLGVVMMLMGLLVSIPIFGPLLLLTVLPALSAGWVNCSHMANAGTRPTILHLFAPFTSPSKKTLWTLGLIYAAGGWLSLQGADLVDPVFRDNWRIAMDEGTDEARTAALMAAQEGMLLRLAFVIPLGLAFWHAPVIAIRESCSAPKALFGSIIASTRNFLAFATYGAAWVLADLVLSLGLGTLLSLLGAGQFALIVAMPASLLFCAAFYASLAASIDGCVSFD